jgi:hypothetical protein
VGRRSGERRWGRQRTAQQGCLRSSSRHEAALGGYRGDPCDRSARLMPDAREPAACLSFAPTAVLPYRLDGALERRAGLVTERTQESRAGHGNGNANCRRRSRRRDSVHPAMVPGRARCSSRTRTEDTLRVDSKQVPACERGSNERLRPLALALEGLADVIPTLGGPWGLPGRSDRCRVCVEQNAPAGKGLSTLARSALPQAGRAASIHYAIALTVGVSRASRCARPSHGEPRMVDVRGSQRVQGGATSFLKSINYLMLLMSTCRASQAQAPPPAKRHDLRPGHARELRSSVRCPPADRPLPA